MTDYGKNVAEFDLFAQEYRDILTDTVNTISGTDAIYFSKYKIEEAEQYLAQKRILDLGCGDGITAECISEICSVESYHGLDISQKSIEVARKRKVANSTFNVYDGYNIPYEDNTFETVFIACVMHHINVSEREHILLECKRVLKNDGVIIIFEHNPLNPLTRKVVDNCPFDADAVLLKPKELKNLLTTVGFNPNIITKYTIFMPRKGFFLKMLGIEKHLKWCPLGGQYYCIAVK